MKILSVLSLSALAVVASAAGNVVQNSDFGVGSGTLANWDVIEYIDGMPTSGIISTTTQFWTSSRFSAEWGEFQGQGVIRGGSLRQDFGPVTNVEEISIQGLSHEQIIMVGLRYTDGSEEIFHKNFFTLDPVLNNATDWVKWDLTGSLNQGKTLKGIEVRVDQGDLNSGYQAWLDDVTVRATAVPEPASMAVLGLGAATLLRRRRRA